MRAFDFRLQTKLDISVRQEDIARENLQASLQVRTEIARRLDRLDDRVQEIESSIREQNQDTAAFSILVTRRQYLPLLQQHKTEVKEHLHEADTVVDSARSLLLERARETNTLEKLKQRQWQEYLKEAMHEEQKVIDELAASGHFRKKLQQV